MINKIRLQVNYAEAELIVMPEYECQRPVWNGFLGYI